MRPAGRPAGRPARSFSGPVTYFSGKMSSKKPPLARANRFLGCRTPQKQPFSDPVLARFRAKTHSNQRDSLDRPGRKAARSGSITNRSVFLEKGDFHPLSAALAPPLGGVGGGGLRPSRSRLLWPKAGFWPKEAGSGRCEPASLAKSRLLPSGQRSRLSRR